MADTQARVVIRADDKASKVIANVRQELLGLSAVGGRLGAIVSPLGGVAGAVAALGAGVAGVKLFVGAIDDLADTAEGLGVTAVQLSELRSKAAEAGVDAGSLDSALSKLNKRLAEAKAGSEEAAAAFKAMGIDPAKLRGTEDALRAIAERFSEYANTAEKSALAQELFGKSGAKFVSYLSQGADGLRQFTGITEETVREAGKLQGEIDKLANSFDRLKNKVIGGVVPASNTLIEGFKRIDFGAVFEPIRNYALFGVGTAFRELQQQALKVGYTLRDEKIAAEAKALEDALYGASKAAGQIAPKLPQIGASAKKAAPAVKELAQVTDDYAASIRRAMQAERERQGVDELRSLGDAEARRVEELDRLAELEGNLTRAQRERLDVVAQLRESGRVNDDQVARLTNDIYGLATATDAATKAAFDFGFTFSSAFEDLIVEGAKFSDVIRGLEKDIVRMVTRMLVTDPVSKGVGGFLGRGMATLSGGGSWFDALGDAFIKAFGMASGGPVMGGHPYFVGEKGPELFVPRQSGTIVPNGAAANSITINIAGSATRETANQIAAAVSRQLAIANARAFV